MAKKQKGYYSPPVDMLTELKKALVAIDKPDVNLMDVNESGLHTCQAAACYMSQPRAATNRRYPPVIFRTLAINSAIQIIHRDTGVSMLLVSPITEDEQKWVEQTVAALKAMVAQFEMNMVEPDTQ